MTNIKIKALVWHFKLSGMTSGIPNLGIRLRSLLSKKERLHINMSSEIILKENQKKNLKMAKKSTWGSLACQRNSKYVFNNQAKTNNKKKKQRARNGWNAGDEENAWPPYIRQAVQEDVPDAGCCLEKQSESNLSYSE